MDEAQLASLRITEVRTHTDRVTAAALLSGIWGVQPAESPVPADLMTALTHAGGSVLGAWMPDGTLVGVAIGLAGAPRSERIYSYIAGVARAAAGLGVGRRLKLAQRDWALRQGATHLVWTYDPLIRRNAHFNLNRLGARVTSFVPDYYPPMSDAVNAGDLPDRFVVEWRLADEIGGRPLPPGAGASPVVLGHDAADEPVLRLDVPATGGASEGGELAGVGERAEVGGSYKGGEPVAGGPSEGWGSSGGDELAGVDESSEGGEPSEGGPWIVRAWVPSDIEALRLRDPALGRRWRLAAREAFETLFARGFTPVGVDAEGHYVFVREA